MQTLTRLADRKPLLFVLLALGLWLVSGITIVLSTAALLGFSITDYIPQSVGGLGATCLLLILASRHGWLRKIGIVDFGSWSTWALTILIGWYLVLSAFYAYFGELSFDVRSLFNSQAAREILLRQPVVGFVEETIFRGIVLYTLVRAWGTTRRGLLAAVALQAVLFGVFHALHLLNGSPAIMVGLDVLETTVFGLWLGAFVLGVHSLWPAIVLHAGSNAAVFIKGLSSPWLAPVPSYLRSILFEIPLVLMALWIILSRWPVSPWHLSKPSRSGSPEVSSTFAT